MRQTSPNAIAGGCAAPSRVVNCNTSEKVEQALRVADYTGFLYVDTTEGGRTGYLVEFGDSRQIFEAPCTPTPSSTFAGSSAEPLPTVCLYRPVNWPNVAHGTRR